MMKRKFRIVKVVSNLPLMLLNACTEFGDCKVVGNTILIATRHTLKDIKAKLQTLFLSGYTVILVNTYTSDILQWIEELQINNVISQFKGQKFEN